MIEEGLSQACQEAGKIGMQTTLAMIKERFDLVAKDEAPVTRRRG